MNSTKNTILPGAEGKPIALDIFCAAARPAPVVIYAHGFNGFKDWAAFDLIAARFAQAGFTFVKFNFSHNGTTPDHPEEFVDLEAFGQNNYTKELHDLQVVIDWVRDGANPHAGAIDARRIYLIGHSMGGGIVLLKGGEERAVKGIATWASIGECKTPWGSWTADRLEEWKRTGVQYYKNSRTGQDMPLYYQLYEDYQQHKDRLDIKAAVKRLDVPLLICHGTYDEAVSIINAYELHAAARNAELFELDTDHVFGRRHPWTETGLPDPAQKVVDRTIQFFTALGPK
jgi:uncharacterized protein